MNLYISHMTAVWFWRTVYPIDRSPSGAMFSQGINDACTCADDVWTMAPAWVTPAFERLIGGRIDVLVGSHDARWKSATRISHVWQGPLPDESLYSLGNGVFIASPEFAFLLMARACSLYQLVAYGCELCGGYSFDPNARRGFRKRQSPLTTLAKLTNYLESARAASGTQSAKGLAKAFKALRYVTERSASPMETASMLLMSLPYRHGGYGIETPELNSRIDLPPKLSAVVGKAYLKADFLWRKAFLVLEYQGEHDHAGRDALNSDSKRLSVLKELGYDVDLLTVSQVQDLAAFELIVMHVARKTRKRVPSKELGMTPARRRLRKELFSWNASSGVPQRYAVPLQDNRPDSSP